MSKGQTWRQDSNPAGKKHGRIRVLPPHADLDAAFFHHCAIPRDDAEYILSTFKGIHDQQPLFPGHLTTAEYILQKYDAIALASEK